MTLSSFFKRKAEHKKQNNQTIKVIIEIPISTNSPDPVDNFIKRKLKRREINTEMNMSIENFFCLFLAEKESKARFVPTIKGIKKESMLKGIQAGR